MRDPAAQDEAGAIRRNAGPAASAFHRLRVALIRCGVGPTKKNGPAFADPLILGAVARNRTADLLITNQLLYQLSYNSP